VSTAGHVPQAAADVPTVTSVPVSDTGAHR
jgi:hypothetical protein